MPQDLTTFTPLCKGVAAADLRHNYVSVRYIALIYGEEAAVFTPSRVNFAESESVLVQVKVRADMSEFAAGTAPLTLPPPPG